MKPGNRWFIYWMVFVLLLSQVSAEDPAPDEDFEGQTLGAVPTNTWYSVTESQPTYIQGKVRDCSAVTSMTNQCWKIESDGGASGFPTVSLSISEEHTISEISFDYNNDWVSKTIWLDFIFQGGARAGVTFGGVSGTFNDDLYCLEAGDTYDFITATQEGRLKLVFNWATDDFDVYLNDVFTKNCTFNTAGTGSAAKLNTWRFAYPAPTGATDTVWIDDIDLHGVDFTGAFGPAAPPGLEGITTDADTDSFTVGFLVSPDDPDQTFGSFDYSLLADTGSGFSQVASFTSGNAVEGVLTWSGTVTATADVQFKATATNTTSGFTSIDSCIITLDSTVDDYTASCGEEVTLVITTGSGLTDDDGGLFGGDKNGLATALQISVPALEFSMGVMLMLLVTAGGYYAGRQMGAFSACFLGIILAYTLGLMPFWSIYVGGFLLAAVAVLYVRSRGALNGS